MTRIYPSTPADYALEARHESRELRDAIDFRAGWNAAIRAARHAVEIHEHDYNWTWDADQWTEEDMDHAAMMIGDCMGILDSLIDDQADARPVVIYRDR